VVSTLVWNLLDKNVAHYESQKSMTDTLLIVRTALMPYLPAIVGAGDMPLTYRVARNRIARHISESIRYPCCTKGCTLYYGARANIDACPVCEQPRKRATKSFFYFSILTKIIDAFADPLMSQHMRHGHQWTKATAERAAAREAAKAAAKAAKAAAAEGKEEKKIRRHDDDEEEEEEEEKVMAKDVYDGAMWKDVFLPVMGGGEDPINVALKITVDGVEVCKQPKHTIWTIIVDVLNYPSNIRVKRAAQWCIGFAPGPSVADLNQFLGTPTYHNIP